MYDPKLFEGMVIFVEVVSLGSFTAVADKTGHSTSFISKEISKLESRLGLRLLHRTTRRLSLTSEGELYYRQCQQLVKDAQQLQDAMGGQQQEPKGLLRVSAPISFGLSRLQPVLCEFIERYPQIDLELDLSDRKVDLVAEGIDVAVRAVRQMDDSSLISKRILQSYGMTLAAPAYLEKHGMPKAPKDLIDHQTITYTHLKQPNVWEYQDKNGNDHSVQLNCRVASSSPEMELAMCLAGQGITRLPAFNLNGEVKSGQLVEVLADYQSLTITMHLVYPSRKHLSPRVRAFIDFVSEAFENYRDNP